VGVAPCATSGSSSSLSERASSSTRRPCALRYVDLGEGGIAGRQQDVGGAEQPGGALAVRAVEGGAAVFAGGGERERFGAAPGAVGGEGVDDRLERGVGPRIGLAEGTQHLLDVGLVRAAQRPQRADVHTALGERAGLVQTDHIDPGQALDRGQFLDQALLAAEPDDADREGDGGEQDQASGIIGTMPATVRRTASSPGILRV